MNFFDTFCNLVNVTETIKEELDQYKSGEKQESEKLRTVGDELQQDLVVLEGVRKERQAKEVTLEQFT